jgi:hypothetical protein
MKDWKGGRMEKHFSSRGEAYAEAVAAKMNASRKPSTKLAQIIQFPVRNVPEAWRSRASRICSPNETGEERLGQTEHVSHGLEATYVRPQGGAVRLP